MLTQVEIAEHLGLNQSEVSRHLGALGIEWKTSSLTAIRLAYLGHLRAVAAGHRSHDGMDLTHERALTERVDRELKQLTLAEKKGQLVNIAQLEPELARQYMAFKAELEARDDKLKDELDTLYGIDTDLQLLQTHTRNALAHLSRHDGGGAGAAAAADDVGDADGLDDNDGLGPIAPPTEPQSHGQAGPLQR